MRGGDLPAAWQAFAIPHDWGLAGTLGAGLGRLWRCAACGTVWSARYDQYQADYCGFEPIDAAVLDALRLPAAAGARAVASTRLTAPAFLPRAILDCPRVALDAVTRRRLARKAGIDPGELSQPEPPPSRSRPRPPSSGQAQEDPLARARRTLEALIVGEEPTEADLQHALQFAERAFDGPIPGLAAEHVGTLKLLWASRRPPSPPPRPTPSRGLVELLCRIDPERPRFLALIQDFRSMIENPQGCFTLLAIEDQRGAAEYHLFNAGQRHPGIVVEAYASNGFAPGRDKLPVPLTRFVAWRGAALVLAHCPSRNNFERFCINAVYRADRAAYEMARSGYFERPVLTLFGVLRTAGDSENYEVEGIAMQDGDRLISVARAE